MPEPTPAELAAAVASCPGYENSPNPCRCPCYGCKHHCSAHNPDEATAEHHTVDGTQYLCHADDHYCPTPARRQTAYDAVYAYIRALGDQMPPDPVHRNVMIWRGVNAALDAGPTPAPVPADVREQIAEAVYEGVDLGGFDEQKAADAVLRVPTIAEAFTAAAAVARVRAAAALHRQGLISNLELYAVIGAAPDPQEQP